MSAKQLLQVGIHTLNIAWVQEWQWGEDETGQPVFIVWFGLEPTEYLGKVDWSHPTSKLSEDYNKEEGKIIERWIASHTENFQPE